MSKIQLQETISGWRWRVKQGKETIATGWAPGKEIAFSQAQAHQELLSKNPDRLKPVSGWQDQ
jgi:hypothetical protein